LRMRPPEPARNARFRFNCRIPLVRASSGREGRGRAPLTAPAPRPPRQSQSFFRGYGSSLPTSLTHVPPLGQRLRTLRTCCGYRYDRGAAPRRRRLRRRRAGPLAFHGPSGALRRGRSGGVVADAARPRLPRTSYAHVGRAPGSHRGTLLRRPNRFRSLPSAARPHCRPPPFGAPRRVRKSRQLFPGPPPASPAPVPWRRRALRPAAHARGSGMLARRPVDRRCALGGSRVAPTPTHRHTAPPKSGRPISQARLTRGRPQWPRNPSSRRPSRFLA